MIARRMILPLALGALGFASGARGQGDSQRLREVELKVSRLDTAVRRVDHQYQALSRNDLENSKGGVVLTDIKGIALRIGGFVQADFMYDTRAIGNRYAMQPSSITVPTYDDAATTFSIRQSRLNFTASGPLGNGTDFNAILEFDLYGPDGSSNPRIRHAWISVGKWGFGQYWSNFMDNDTWPNLVDYWGPNAYVWTRQIQVRFTQKFGKSSTVALALEEPGSDLTLPAGWAARSLYPDVTASYLYSWDGGDSHVRLAGLLHPISYRTAAGEAENILGGAGNLSANIRTFGRDAVKFQVSYGTGYARYNEDLGGEGYDAFPGPAPEVKLRTSTQLYLWAFYDRWWSDKLSSTIGWGNINVRNNRSYMPSTTIERTNYGAVNLLWYPNKFFKTGVEVLYGNRKNLDGRRGEDLRIQWTAFITM